MSSAIGQIGTKAPLPPLAALLSLRRKLPPLAALPSCDGCYRCHVGQDPLEEIASVRARRACASLRVPIVCTSATPQSVWLPGRPPYPMLEPVPLLMELVFGKDLHHRRSGFQPPAEDICPAEPSLNLCLKSVVALPPASSTAYSIP